MKKKIDLNGGSKVAAAAQNEELTVFVGGLPFNTSEEQVKKDFEDCGEIERFNMLKNDEGKPRGIAFITYKTAAGVEAALKFNGDEYNGRTLKVNLASEGGKGKGKDGKGKGKDGKGKDGKGKGKADRNDALTVKISCLSWDLSEETVKKDFGECGELTRCVMPKNEEGKPKGFAFIEFKDEEGVKKALEFNEQEYAGRTIYVMKAEEAGAKGKGKDGKGKDGKGKDKGKDKGKGKKGKKGDLSEQGRAARDGSMVEGTGTKQTFADSDDDDEKPPPAKKAKKAAPKPAEDDDDDSE